MEKFIGVVLAGGRSRRMGEDKSQLVRVDRTMLNFTQEQLFSAGAHEVVVSVAHDEAKGIADQYQDLGPLGGIFSVMQHNPTTPHLFVPVDLPFLNSNSLTRLAREGLQGRHSVCYFKQPIPLFLYPNATMLDGLSQTLDQKKDLSLFSFIRKTKALVLNQAISDNWFNANTPEQWQQALSQIQN